MERSAIIAAIEHKVGSTKYNIWTVGVTDDPNRRWKEHGESKYWKHWDADNESDARSIEKHFVDKGMKGDTGGGGTADYVYIF